ncbi:intradiol ring-cleavage dioxygenase [Microbulbifer sp. CAU 1566]|uniref:intradiol ring-cleavage dioxygenase n=1 Tax=Microbulbifer sp. CAU 1566 TaxID=2933269 RepID=UPI002005B3DB|nr:intradiol ring-cleavage dioxygenase [Microbulbifer sp. CAU 1566]MCK7596234.1 intradiol ring-cleavage dioxygenase [Microbulbifer sp. CAU 1566]
MHRETESPPQEVGTNADGDVHAKNLNRRQMLSAMGMTSMALLAGCNSGGSSGGNANSGSSSGGSSSGGSSSSSSSGSSSGGTTGTCTLIPQETEGPYPLTAVLSNSAMARSDITEGKTGLPLTLVLNLVDVNNDCAPITNASVYVWHCDKDGRYSGYSQPGADERGTTYCRGIQDVDSDGMVLFETIYPGWYSGRITHIHFQVFLFSSSTATATSQIAFPQEITEAVYDSTLYADKGQNSSVGSFASDNVFSDGVSYQLADVTGDLENGYVATLQVGIAV